MRSKLFVPGTHPHRFAKAIAAGADAVSLDLEDAVPADAKDAAPAAVAAFVHGAEARAAAPTRIVRCNGVGTPPFEADLRAVAGSAVAIVNLPKVEDAIPAKAFETNWTYLTNNLVAVAALMFVAVWIVPLLRRLDLMSDFHYLEIRFHPAIRVLASALCILVQLGSRMSVILYLPALAIATITGLPVAWSILIMGTFTIVYTALGGMKAVVWTDIVQLAVFYVPSWAQVPGFRNYWSGRGRVVSLTSTFSF